MSTLYGLIGEKLKHSFSASIHSCIFKELNMQGYYNLFELKKEELGTAVAGLKVLGAKGINVTIPYKVEIMKYLDDISDEANNIGAINTIYFNNDIAVGYNTDYYGFGMMLNKYNVDTKNKRAVILGTGGASKAVIQYLIDKGIKDIILVSRKVNDAKEKFREHRVISYDEIKQLKEKDLIINSTPCGMYPNINDKVIEKKQIQGFEAAVDLIYNPKETVFLKYAKELGIKSVNGLYMLVGQAVKAQEIWNDIQISSEIVDSVFTEIEKLVY